MSWPFPEGSPSVGVGGSPIWASKWQHLKALVRWELRHLRDRLTGQARYNQGYVDGYKDGEYHARSSSGRHP